MDYQTITFCKLIKNVIHLNKEGNLIDNVDWAYMVQLAKEHNLLPIFMEEAVRHPSYVSRLDYRKEMNEALIIIAMQAKRTNAFLNLYKEFLEEGLHPIVMKGLICRDLYRNLCDHRPSGDEDILIRPVEFQKVQEVLIANGYVPEHEIETEAQLELLQEVSFIHPKEKLHIEVHLNPMGRENDARSRMSDYFIHVFDEYREVEINGVMIRTMSHQEHLLYLILHAFKHFTWGGFGVRQVLDILLYQEQYATEIDMKRLHKVLLDFRADIFWSDLIHIGNSYFDFELSTLYAPNCPRELLEDMIQCGVFGNKTKAELAAATVTKFATGNYLKDKTYNSVTTIWKAVFPSKALLVNQFPYLAEKPWLLPVGWVKRWGRFVKGNKNSGGNLAVESMKISRRRMKLLKKYDLI